MCGKLAFGVVFIICTVIGIADAAYLITLKNGNEYVTARYWHEGSQILFDTYGGVFGISKSFVDRIEQTDQNLTLARLSRTTEKLQNNAQAGDQTMSRETEIEKLKVARTRDFDDPIVGELNRLKQQSKEVDGMLTGEIRELLNRVTAYKNRISKDSKLFFEYGREFNDAQELGNRIESALRTRTQ